MDKKNYDIVRFDDKLVYHGSYLLSPRSIKTICYLVAKYVNPEVDSQLPTRLIVPVKELAQAILDGTQTKLYKSIYQEIDGICEELTSSQIRFNSKVSVRGMRLRGYINWCSSAIPIYDEKGNASIQLSFDPIIAQFFIGLSRYVRLYRPELNRLQSGHSIRLFQMLKGIRNKMASYETVSKEVYEVERLKFLFGVDGKYKQFKDFNKRVIKPAIKEINEKTTIQITDIQPHRKNRRIVALEFFFTDQASSQQPKQTESRQGGEGDFIPTEKDLAPLTWAQRKAYDSLVGFGVKKGIALLRLLPDIKGDVFKGFEDYFVHAAIAHFKKTAKRKDAGTFVKWWHVKRIFDVDSDVWSKMVEQVQVKKRDLENNKPENYDNRLIAADMTEQEFKDWYQKGKG